MEGNDTLSRNFCYFVVLYNGVTKGATKVVHSQEE